MPTHSSFSLAHLLVCFSPSPRHSLLFTCFFVSRLLRFYPRPRTRTRTGPSVQALALDWVGIHPEGQDCQRGPAWKLSASRTALRSHCVSSATRKGTVCAGAAARLQRDGFRHHVHITHHHHSTVSLLPPMLLLLACCHCYRTVHSNLVKVCSCFFFTAQL